MPSRSAIDDIANRRLLNFEVNNRCLVHSGAFASARFKMPMAGLEPALRFRENGF